MRFPSGVAPVKTITKMLITRPRLSSSDRTCNNVLLDAICCIMPNPTTRRITIESQVHRELASGLSMPVGFKNRTDGDVQVAIEAIRSARHPHWFPSLTRAGLPAILGTTGNDKTHLVLRGGSQGPNYSEASVEAAAALLAKNGLPARVMVDFSHANSGKDYRRQSVVCKDVAAQITAGNRNIMGAMIESNLVAGRQELREGATRADLVYGQSLQAANQGRPFSAGGAGMGGSNAAGGMSAPTNSAGGATPGGGSK